MLLISFLLVIFVNIINIITHFTFPAAMSVFKLNYLSIYHYLLPPLYEGLSLLVHHILCTYNHNHLLWNDSRDDCWWRLLHRWYFITCVQGYIRSARCSLAYRHLATIVALKMTEYLWLHRELLHTFTLLKVDWNILMLLKELACGSGINRLLLPKTCCSLCWFDMQAMILAFDMDANDSF